MEKEQAKERLANFDMSTLEADDIKILKLYLKAYSDGFQEQQFYDLDNPEKLIVL